MSSRYAYPYVFLAHNSIKPGDFQAPIHQHSSIHHNIAIARQPSGFIAYVQHADGRYRPLANLTYTYSLSDWPNGIEVKFLSPELGYMHVEEDGALDSPAQALVTLLESWEAGERYA